MLPRRTFSGSRPKPGLLRAGLYPRTRDVFPTERRPRRLEGSSRPRRRHLFADAACGSAAFDAAFRRFVADLLPDHKLERIPRDDEFYTDRVGFDLSQCRLTKAAGDILDYPRLEGVKINGHWAIIYSQNGIGCRLDRDHDGGCKGYMRKDGLKIWTNTVIYSTQP